MSSDFIQWTLNRYCKVLCQEITWSDLWFRGGSLWWGQNQLGLYMARNRISNITILRQGVSLLANIRRSFQTGPAAGLAGSRAQAASPASVCGSNSPERQLHSRAGSAGVSKRLAALASQRHATKSRRRESIPSRSFRWSFLDPSQKLWQYLLMSHCLSTGLSAHSGTNHYGQKTCVLVYSGCYNRIPLTGGLKQ